MTRRGYLGASLLMFAIVAVGFWPSYFGLLSGTGVDKEIFIHVHAAVYVSWLVFFLVQTALIAGRNVALHRQLGRFGVVWGFVVLAVGLATSVLRFETMVRAGLANEARAFVIWPLLDMVIFAAFFLPAIHYRHKPAIHKRLMFVAMTSLLIAAVARLTGLDTWAAHAALVVLWLSPILVVMANDFGREHVVHPIYVIGAFVLTLSTFRDSLATTHAWGAFTAWLTKAVLSAG